MSLALLLMVALPAGPRPVLAQGATPLDRAGPEGGSSAQFDEMVRLAADRLERALLIDEEDEDGRVPLVVEAERYARAAAELDPAAADGWFLTAASLGLRAHYESTRSQIRMAGEVWTLAATALARDPDHAGAHHILGRLNLEAMSLSGVTRLIARHFYGSTLLREASWEKAESHLRRAVSLEPDALYHRLWLARLYIERGEDDDARRLLEEIAAAPATAQLDRILKEEAARDLERL